MDEYYIPMLEEYLYHHPHVILLGNNEASADRSKNLRPGDIETSRDYAERLVFEKGKEIMSQHFGSHPSLSMEGVGLRYFPLEEVDKYYNNDDVSFNHYTKVHTNILIFFKLSHRKQTIIVACITSKT